MGRNCADETSDIPRRRSIWTFRFPNASRVAVRLSKVLAGSEGLARSHTEALHAVNSVTRGSAAMTFSQRSDTERQSFADRNQVDQGFIGHRHICYERTENQTPAAHGPPRGDAKGFRDPCSLFCASRVPRRPSHPVQKSSSGYHPCWHPCLNRYSSHEKRTTRKWSGCCPCHPFLSPGRA